MRYRKQKIITEGPTFLMISGHDYRSRRKANVHFIAREFSRLGKMRVFSLGYSLLSIPKKDPRLSLWNRANRVEVQDEVECYLWRSLWHPINLRISKLARMEPSLFRNYVKHIPQVLKDWIADSKIIILESGMSIILFDIIKQINPATIVIYLCSDALSTIGCSAHLSNELRRIGPLMNGIRIPSRKLIEEFPPETPLFFVPHGIDADNITTQAPSPYPEGIHAVSVGSMLFDPTFFEMAAGQFPQITFHVIGGGRNAASLSAPNIKVYDEMPFYETLPYIKHASLGIAPYEGSKVSSYLVDTSMKLMQFEAFGIPAVCPVTAAGMKPGRFGYVPGDSESIASAINTALACGNFTGAPVLSWEEVAKRILHPEQFPDTYIS